MNPETTRMKLFGELVEMAPQERLERMAQLADEHPGLAAELQALLRSHDSSVLLQLSSFLRAGLLRWVAPPIELAFGERLGPYRIERELGRGGMGVVYLAIRDDDTIDVQVAIKLTSCQTDLLDLIRHEARLLSALSHPNIARFIDVGRGAEGSLYLVTEYISGESLQRRLENQVASVDELRRWAYQLCAALSFAHARQICHGDLKPANVMIDDVGDVRLLDFGIGVTLLQEQVAAPVIGFTPVYAAPEVTREGVYTVAAEIYSLGRVLSALGRDVPLTRGQRADWQAIIERATAADPARRYESMAELGRDLARVGGSEVLRARERDQMHRLQRGLRRYWLPLGLSLALVLGTIAGLIAVTDQRDALATALDRSERDRTTADRTLGFVLDALAAASSEGANKVDVTVREFADATGRNLEPLWQADPDTAGRIVLNLARVDHGQERYARVIERVDDALQHTMGAPTEMRLRIQKVDALRELSRLDEAWAELESPLWPPSTREDWRVAQTRARLLRTSGKPVEAEAITRITLANLQEASEEEQIALAGEMVTYIGDQGRLAEALVELDRQRNLLQPLVHLRPNVAARNAQNRALILHWLGRSAEARVALEEAVSIYRERLAPMHSSHADVAMIGVEIDLAVGEQASASERVERALQIYRQQLGERHPKISEVLHTQGNLALMRNDPVAAAESYAAALSISGELPARRTQAAITRYSLCSAKFTAGDAVAALPLCEQSLSDLEATVSDPSPHLSNALANLGRVESELALHERAVEHLRRAVEMAAKSFDPASLDVANIRLYLAISLARSNQIEESRAVFERADAQFSIADLDRIGTNHARSYVEHGLALAQTWNDPPMQARFEALARRSAP